MVARPRLSVDAPTVVRAGDELEVVVHVDSPRAFPARGLEVAFVGTFDSRTRRSVLYLDRRRVPLAGDVVPAGRGLYRFRLVAPVNLPVSARSPDWVAAYAVRAGLDLPWRLDPWDARSVQVEPGRRPLPEGLTCGASVTVPFARATGGALRVDLVGALRESGLVQEPLRFTIGRLSVPPLQPITAIDVDVPRSVLPSLATPELTIDWELHVFLDDALLGTRPVFVRAATTIVPVSRPRARPDQLEAWWSGAASAVGLEVSGATGRASGVVRGTAVEAWIEDGRFQSALSYPPLELDLEHGGHGRHANQIAAVIAAMADAFAAFEVLHLDDRRTHVRHDRATAGTVDGFLAALHRLAGRLGQDRPSVPPPACMADALLAWSRLATWLEGTLSTARMRIDGRLGDARVEIATLWQGPVPWRTRVTLLPARFLELASPVRVSWIEAGRPPVDTRGQPVPAERRTLLERIAIGAYALEVQPDRVVLDLPAPMLDGDFIRERLVQMVQLVDLLRALGAPFR